MFLALRSNWRHKINYNSVIDRSCDLRMYRTLKTEANMCTIQQNITQPLKGRKLGLE